MVGNRYTVLIGIGLLAMCTALAEGEGTQDGEFVLLNKYRESVRAERWEETVGVYEELRGFPAFDDHTVQYLYALAQYNRGQLHPAETMLGTVLAKESKHVEALYLLSKVFAKQARLDTNPIRKQQLELQAKDTLIVAAGAGQYVYRDIRGPDDATLFAELASDSKFVLAVMKASSAHRVSTTAIHNPFRSPLTRVGDEKKDPKKGKPPTDAELEKELERLYEELVSLAADEHYEELEKKLEWVGELLQRYGPGSSETSREVRQRLTEKFAEFETVLELVKLQEWVSEGNAELKAMVESIEGEDYDAALAAFTQIEAIVSDMRREQDAVFERNAERLYLRGKQLAERAQRHKEIAEFELVITGIVIASTAIGQGASQAHDSAIINDRIHRVGDRVYTDEQAIDSNPNLTLLEIGETGTTVTFAYYGTTFVRAIKSRSDAAATGGAVAR